MQLYKVKLINYIGIYNGMGINSISIDFSKCKHKIIVIKGDNGSGKSTLFKALTPINDSSYDFIPDLDAEKEISYFLNDGSILYIHYITPADRKKTSCHVKRKYINKKIIDLNPNGNVNEGKERIYEVLGIDSGFITLSQLSSEDRGLADKKPADRKKFINSKISELDAYNEIYKKITKKTTALKSMVLSITNKIDSIGNVEQIQNSIKTLESTLGALEDRKALLISRISTNKEKLSNINKDGNILDLYNSNKSKLETINSSLNLYYTDSNYTELDINKIDTKTKLLIQKIESINSTISTINLEKTKLSSKIDEKQIKLESIGDISLINSIQEKIKELKLQRNQYIDSFKKLNFKNYNNISEEEYEFSLHSIDRINNLLLHIRNTYAYDEIEFSYMNINYIPKYTQSQLDKLQENLANNEKLILSQNVLKDSCKGFDLIPKDCNHKNDCIFISTIINAKNQLLSDIDYNKLIKLSESIKNDIQNLKEELQKQSRIESCIKDIKSLVELIQNSYNVITKFPINITSIKSILLTTKNIEIDTKLYLEYTNYIGFIKGCDNDIKSLSDKLSVVSSNKELIVSLTQDIEDYKKSYNEYNSNLLKNQKLFDLYNTELNELINKTEFIKAEVEKKKTYDSLLDEKKILIDTINNMLSQYKIAEQLSISIDNDLSELKKINVDTIPDISNNINSNKYKIILYNDYIKEYKEYSDTYEKLETIKYYCSPTTGIQTIFMEMYMNDIINISNNLLAMFFNGEYVLHPFVINEKEFRIPCLGKGMMNNDISSMSTSQICMISMILSFALLRQTSETFNIIKIDEIDGGLDTQNRLKFINVLNNLMEKLNYDQCIMISHNTELGMYNADIIILKNTDPNLKLDGNIIFDLNNGAEDIE